MSLSRILRFGCLVPLMALSACSALKQGSAEEIVAERADLRWKALVSGDWKKAYEFSTPAYRKAVSLEQFIGSQIGAVARRGHEILSVKCTEDVCEAMVRLQYSVALPGFAKGSGSSTDYAERWVREGGQWYVYRRI
nr:hypothetical protein [Zoogloeaceae bacterium]